MPYSRVFVLGPSHHVHLKKCSISGAVALDTPIGCLKVDTAARELLMATGLFDLTTQQVDEEEHSIEMHLPFLAFLLGSNPNAVVVPIIVGNISESSALRYAEIFQPYFDDDSTLFVISRLDMNYIS